MSFRHILKSGIPKSYSLNFTPKTYSLDPKERVPEPKVRFMLSPKESGAPKSCSLNRIAVLLFPSSHLSLYSTIKLDRP